MEWLWQMAVAYGLKLIGAIIVLIIGLWVIKAIMKALRKNFDKRGMDESLKPFLTSMISALLKIMLAISVLTMLGIEMTSFIAILGAAGLAVGLALSGTLQEDIRTHPADTITDAIKAADALIQRYTAMFDPKLQENPNENRNH